MGRILVRGGRVLTMDPRLGDLDPGDVLLDAGRIAAVAPGIPAADAEVVDARGAIVLPGFVDAHRHVWQTQLRTVATDWTLFDYFVRMRCVYGACYAPEDAYLGNLAGALEAVHAGITTVVDHCHVLGSPAHTDAALDGLRASGLRAVFCYGLYPSPAHRPFRPSLDPGWRFEDARRLRRGPLAADDARIVFGLAPTEVEATPLDQVAAELRFGRELGAARISCHVAMGGYDRGRRTVAALAEAGLLGEDLLLVHGAALTDAELRRAADAGAAIAATPETELQMGMGHPVTVRALAHGVRASLGIDIVSNYAGDMFGQMRLQLQAERGHAHARAPAPPRRVGLRAREVLELATIGGARAAGLAARAGSLTPGKHADLIVVRTDAINMTPALDPVGAVVLHANVHDVDTVVVGGRILKRAGALVGVDWPQLRARLCASSARIVAAARDIPTDEIEAMAAAAML